MMGDERRKDNSYYTEQLRREDNMYRIAQKANGIKPQLCDSLPDDKEIEFVASDESNGVDVDDLKSRPIWADGFIEGAKWMRSRIK